MSESMAKRVRKLEADLFSAREENRLMSRRRAKLEATLEKLLWRLNKDGDGLLPQEALDAEKVLKHG